MIFFKKIEKKIIFLLFLMFSLDNLIFSKSIKTLFFELDSNILEVENTLISEFQDYVALIHEVIHTNKSEVQYHYLLEESIISDYYHANNEDFKFILQKNSSKENYISVQIKLNRVKQFIIGDNFSLNKKFIFDPFQKLKSMKLDDQNQFFENVIYEYLALPILKSTLQINLSFYDDKLFESIYYLNLSQDKLSFFKDYLKNKYNLIEANNKDSSFLYRDKNSKIEIYLNPFNKKSNIYILRYSLLEKEKIYKDYIQKVRNTVSEFITNLKFAELIKY